MRDQNKKTIQQIDDFYVKKGFKCKRDYPTIFNPHDPKKTQVNKIDVCCWKTYPKKIIRCIEVEDSQKQAVKNYRAGVQHCSEMRKKGFDSKFCQTVVGENWEDACR